jgi:TctA family transporter
MTRTQPDGPYAWLEASAVRNASDIVLGGILLAVAAAAVVGSRGLSFGTWGEPDAGFFPTLVAWLLAVVGILLLARGALGRVPYMRWKAGQIVLVAALCAAVTLGAALYQILLLAVLYEALPLGGWLWSAANTLLRYGPPEWAAYFLLVLAVAVCLARLSRLRAAGMMLLGLLLPLVGLDSITGTLRLTMGVEQLIYGFPFLVVAPGIILVAECLICLFSPALLLATYTRRIDGWRDPDVPAMAAIGMRIVAVLVLAASCYLAFKVLERVLDIGVLLLFGAFGIASKIFGWNRLVLLLAFSYGVLLEQSIRQSMMLWGGDPRGIFWQPVGGAILAAAGCILVTALVLSFRRALSRNRSSAVAA